MSVTFIFHFSLILCMGCFSHTALPCASNEKSVSAMEESNITKTVGQTTLQEVETHSKMYVL